MACGRIGSLGFPSKASAEIAPDYPEPNAKIQAQAWFTQAPSIMPRMLPLRQFVMYAHWISRYNFGTTEQRKGGPHSRTVCRVLAFCSGAC